MILTMMMMMMMMRRSRRRRRRRRRRRMTKRQPGRETTLKKLTQCDSFVALFCASVFVYFCVTFSSDALNSG